jgi:outer membrane protein W
MDSRLTIRSAALGEQRSSLDINPLVVGVGVGMRF